MSSASDNKKRMSRGASAAFEEAFERLKSGVPIVLPPGTRISQNNVAKEAGCTPSALRKERFPEVVKKIQQYIEENPDNRISRKEVVNSPVKNKRNLAEQWDEHSNREAAATSRVLSLLVEVADLRRQVLELEQRLGGGKIIAFRKID